MSSFLEYASISILCIAAGIFSFISFKKSNSIIGKLGVIGALVFFILYSSINLILYLDNKFGIGLNKPFSYPLILIISLIIAKLLEKLWLSKNINS